MYSRQESSPWKHHEWFAERDGSTVRREIAAPRWAHLFGDYLFPGRAAKFLNPAAGPAIIEPALDEIVIAAIPRGISVRPALP
ncbi:amine oxidase [Streptomyces sp. NBRC 110611]|nr:amine oxidase [Streptomyces sp. NBRC 110611]